MPADWLGRWNLDPLLLIALGVAAWLWQRGCEPAGKRWSLAAFGLLLFLFVTPFCALTSALFAARVSHHVLLTALAAPMLAMALPASGPRLPGSIAAWTAVQAVTFWLWHAPPLYAAALANDAVYWAMQLSLLGTALGYWAALRRAGTASAAATLLVTTVAMGLLGALITFAGAPLYAPHFASTGAWGLTPLEDQQLAGLIMWVPAAGIYLGAALWLTNRWLSREAGGVAA